MKIVARIQTDFKSKFGVPRQSGLVEELRGKIVFEPEYRNPEALRGLEGFSHIWLLWDFSLAHRDEGNWSPTVRPPRLGGNQRMGVWATRSPFRPNNIGLSSVKIIQIELHTPEGPIIWVGGADMMDGTPIYDIKPYLPFTDCHPEATGGFTDDLDSAAPLLEVRIPEEIAQHFTATEQAALKGVLAADPRPHYQDDPNRIYGFRFADTEIRFQVHGKTLEVLTN
ncbi:MAG: tRNA (N6-threonylcarbamoyladenosine(37)-N6)-methyltransferase TrmO [Bacteroidaceae bacterium]|nr:tRNA (N6-threonylcarbamoyladenosine(37)-N6)-methyltransferase TrmO [Bacteroidaceae bacterium]